jgi:hypothetical protein
MERNDASVESETSSRQGSPPRAKSLFYTASMQVLGPSSRPSSFRSSESGVDTSSGTDPVNPAIAAGIPLSKPIPLFTKAFSKSWGARKPGDVAKFNLAPGQQRRIPFGGNLHDEESHEEEDGMTLSTYTSAVSAQQKQQYSSKHGKKQKDVPTRTIPELLDKLTSVPDFKWPSSSQENSVNSKPVDGNTSHAGAYSGASYAEDRTAGSHELVSVEFPPPPPPPPASASTPERAGGDDPVAGPQVLWPSRIKTTPVSTGRKHILFKKAVRLPPTPPEAESQEPKGHPGNSAHRHWLDAHKPKVEARASPEPAKAGDPRFQLAPSLAKTSKNIFMSPFVQFLPPGAQDADPAVNPRAAKRERHQGSFGFMLSSSSSSASPPLAGSGTDPVFTKSTAITGKSPTSKSLLGEDDDDSDNSAHDAGGHVSIRRPSSSHKLARPSASPHTSHHAENSGISIHGGDSNQQLPSWQRGGLPIGGAGSTFEAHLARLAAEAAAEEAEKERKHHKHHHHNHQHQHHHKHNSDNVDGGDATVAATVADSAGAIAGAMEPAADGDKSDAGSEARGDSIVINVRRVNNPFHSAKRQLHHGHGPHGSEMAIGADTSPTAKSSARSSSDSSHNAAGAGANDPSHHSPHSDASVNSDTKKTAAAGAGKQRRRSKSNSGSNTGNSAFYAKPKEGGDSEVLEALMNEDHTDSSAPVPAPAAATAAAVMPPSPPTSATSSPVVAETRKKPVFVSLNKPRDDNV